MERKRPVDVVPKPFTKLFAAYEYFNTVQSVLIDELLNSDKSLVLSAPTGSGKTVAFELAIVRMLQNKNIANETLPKAIYIAPIKALCNEKFTDWKPRFDAVGVTCVQLTGDTGHSNLSEIGQADVVIATPEKWDSLTRRWLDFEKLMRAVQLFIVDEVHLLNENVRGPILEAIVARMKSCGVKRFIVASATIPNAEDLATWIRSGCVGLQVAHHVFDANQRPVPLEKHVTGINLQLSGFQFDMRLNYRLPDIIRKYSENKASLVFCNSRKSTEMAASHLNKMPSAFSLSENQKAYLKQAAVYLTDCKLRKLFVNGIAYHHAGLQYEDRNLIESSFRQGHLMVLISTSTLAMGINLPAHLVVIKSTERYACGNYSEYPENMILQMIGRAGRPQYDTKGVAVLLTRKKNVHKYQMLLNGSTPIESHLHNHLAEHLNSEITLKTIASLEAGMKWIRCTYLYIRAVRNPQHYGFDAKLSKDFVEHKLEELCLRQIKALKDADLVQFNALTGANVKSTAYGHLMARYYLSYETMKNFQQLKGNDGLEDLLKVLARSKEMSEFTLRVNEKKDLNSLNKTPVRFPIKGRISSNEDKILCIMQAVLGNVDIATPYLIQESLKIMRIANRLSKCLLEYTLLKARQEGMDQDAANWYQSILNATILTKCFQAKLWENSEFVAKQLHGIGSTYSNVLAKLGKTTLKSIAKTEARTIEHLLNKSAPFGDEVLNHLISFPDYELKFERETNWRVRVHVKQTNDAYVFKNDDSTVLILGDSLNNLLLIEEDINKIIYERGCYDSVVQLKQADQVEYVYGHAIHSSLVGVDGYAALAINPPKRSLVTEKKAKTKQSRLNFSLNDSLFDKTILSDDNLDLEEFLKEGDTAGLLNSFSLFDDNEKSQTNETNRKEKEKNRVPTDDKIDELESYRFQKSKSMSPTFNFTSERTSSDANGTKNYALDATIVDEKRKKSKQRKLTDFFNLSKSGKLTKETLYKNIGAAKIVENVDLSPMAKKQKTYHHDQITANCKAIENTQSTNTQKIFANKEVSKSNQESESLSTSSETINLTMIQNLKAAKFPSVPSTESKRKNTNTTADNFFDLTDILSLNNQNLFDFPDLKDPLINPLDDTFFEQKNLSQEKPFLKEPVKNKTECGASQTDLIARTLMRGLIKKSSTTELTDHGDQQALGSNFDSSSKPTLHPHLHITGKYGPASKRKRIENNNFVLPGLVAKNSPPKSLTESELSPSVTSQISPLDLSKTAQTKAKPSTSKEDKSTQTNFEIQGSDKKRKRKLPDEDDFKLWHKVSLKFRQVSTAQALSLVTFKKIFWDVSRQHSQMQRLENDTNFSDPNPTNLKIKRNSNFRLKLFENENNSKDLTQANRREIKLINQSVMKLVLEEKCAENTPAEQREIQNAHQHLDVLKFDFDDETLNNIGCDWQF